MSEDAKAEISVVILCYKAGRSAVDFVKAVQSVLEQRGLPYELVLVANFNAEEAATDETPTTVRNLAASHPRMIAVTLQKEGMFGWDVRSGLSRANGETIAFIDGDGQNPPEDVVRVYDALQREHADMAQTYRVKRHDGVQRIFISRVYNTLLRVLFPKVSIYDANSKPKIFTRDALSRLSLHSDDWFIDAEIVIQACYKRFRVAQVPTVFHPQRGRSSFVNLTAVLSFLWSLILYRIHVRSRR